MYYRTKTLWVQQAATRAIPSIICILTICFCITLASRTDQTSVVSNPPAHPSTNTVSHLDLEIQTCCNTLSKGMTQQKHIEMSGISLRRVFFECLDKLWITVWGPFNVQNLMQVLQNVVSFAVILV